MATINATVSVEKEIHDGLMNFAREIMNEYRVAIDGVEFEWIDAGSQGDLGERVLRRLDVRTSSAP